jgi:hypothetical protein
MTTIIKSDVARRSHIPRNTHSYIHQVFDDDQHYPHNTIIKIYADGGLSVTVPHTRIIDNRYDPMLPYKQKITCHVCNSSILNDSYGYHSKTNKHMSKLT